MFRFDPYKKIPRFILQDKNGFAIAKAIEAGMQIMNDTIKHGVDCINDYDRMPEWRLDELAWEYNAPYDYDADVETKRRWIREAESLYSLYGTPNAIYQFLAGYFDSVKLEEAKDYNGDPFHFRLEFNGLWTRENIAWATNAVQTVQNVRSVLDRYMFRTERIQNLYAGCALYSREDGTFQIAVVDMTDVNWYVDELNEMLLDENGVLLIVEGTP